MSRTVTSSGKLKELQADQTRQLILDSALSVLDRPEFEEVTIRAAARQAGVAERTVFRYFAQRADLLSAVAEAYVQRLDFPAPPSDRGELLSYAERLFGRFELHEQLTRSALRSDVYHLVRDATAKFRMEAILKVLKSEAPRADARRLRFAAAHIRYLLTASTWNYFRFTFRFSAEEAVDAVRMMVEDSISGLKRSR